MNKLKDLKPQNVFRFFEEISEIPRGSGNMKKIADYCEDFAKRCGFEYIRDEANNVIIFKPGINGGENSEPIILQGHLDMVCRKTKEREICFEKEGIDLYIDGDFIKARGTTLGADNGIAVAIILAILEDSEISHPPIEAVFTVDEEVGMLGAMALDMKVLKGKKMINIDSEDEGVITVSCAGGGDISSSIPISFKKRVGREVTLSVKGLKGGHSGIEINSGRVNAALLLGRVLDRLSEKVSFDIISINSGDKANVIPGGGEVKLCTDDQKAFSEYAEKILSEIKGEISAREKNFDFEITAGDEGEFSVFDEEAKKKLLSILVCVPNGVIEMSAEIEGLVETSLNFGILKTEEKSIEICISLRSNKKSAQSYLEKRVKTLLDLIGVEYETSGFYPPWEFNDNSALSRIFEEVYYEKSGKGAKIEAIHAGLECGVFASAIEGIDCISVGPEMYDVHSTEERLGISSTQRLYEMLKEVLVKVIN